MKMFVQCVLVNTLQCHDTVDFVPDSGTEDPHRSRIFWLYYNKRMVQQVMT